MRDSPATARLVAYLAEHPGAKFAAIHAHMGGNERAAVQLLARARKAGRIFATGPSRCWYFATEAERDAFLSQRPVKVKRKLKLPTVLAMLQSDTSPIGITHGDVMRATGYTAVETSAALALLQRAGRADRLGAYKDARFFVAGRAQQCVAAFEAHMVALTEARRERRNALRRVNPGGPRPVKVRAAKPPKPPKVAKPAKQKHRQQPMTINASQDAPVTIAKPPKANFKDMPAIVPPHVKVQRLPGCPTRARFEPPKSFRGEFVKEFEQLCRSGG